MKGSISIPLSIGILVCLGRAARGVYEDQGGPAIENWLSLTLSSPWRGVKRVITDDRASIIAERMISVPS